ncbi:hypothetical protein SAMN04489724_0253 [Algoriphagus locisalis]|uniref:Uncharacterized protein n=2 Tax=Algoriphagus locisalis TaxID=305507 RepID=A0A1I7E890_9BACT|nr:hypothetical protein SAMN04489724_0253 [Algoriphagus locisalis]
MRKEFIFLELLSLLCVTLSFGQEAQLAIYDSKEEGLYFDQALIYSYSDHTGLKKEIWIYHSSCSGRFLFDHAAWGREDEMIHYVIAQPDGSYLTFGTEAEGPGNGKIVAVDSVYLESKDARTAIPPNDGYIQFVALPESNKVIAGLESRAYKVRKLKEANGKEVIHLATVDFDTRLIYAFNQQAQELRLPELFSDGLSLGADQLITRIESSYTDSNGKKYWSTLSLETIDPTTYWAPYKEHTLRQRIGEKLITKPLLESMELTEPCY